MLIRRCLPALILASVVWALASAVFTVDVTEYGLVTRFGRVVRVVAEPGLHVTAPFDRVVRLDKRMLFSRPPRSEYLTVDKKNVVVESLATWRIADPERFLGAFTTQAAAEQPLGDLILGGDRRRPRAISGLHAHLRRSGGEPLSADRLRDRGAGSRILPGRPTAST